MYKRQGQQAEGPIDAADHASDRRLAGARVADEDEMAGDVGALEAGLAAQFVDRQHRDLLVHFAFDALETDHRVEFREQFLDAPGRLRGLGGRNLSLIHI